jgi:putative oxidoreductase
MFELAPSLPESKAGSALRRVLRVAPRVAIGALFVFVGYTKFDNDPKGWAEIFEQIGLGQWFRIFTGIVQTLGGVLLVFRRTVTIGAVLTGSSMLGAALVDIFVLGQLPFAIIPLLLLFLIATVWVTSD